MKPQNIRVKRKFKILREIFPNQCLHIKRKRQFAHLKNNNFSGRSRGRNKRFWNILKYWMFYALLCDICHYHYDNGDVITIMTVNGLTSICLDYHYY